jgi:hypothetical protein
MQRYFSPRKITLRYGWEIELKLKWRVAVTGLSGNALTPFGPRSAAILAAPVPAGSRRYDPTWDSTRCRHRWIVILFCDMVIPKPGGKGV